jgi:zinc/manganese transport system permease protein
MLFLALLTVNLVSGFVALGTLLAVGMMVLPATIARFWTRDVTAMIGVAAASAMLSGYLGLVLSHRSGVPPGPSVVLVAAALAAISLLFGRAGGLLRQVLPGRHLEA